MKLINVVLAKASVTRELPRLDFTSKLLPFYKSDSKEGWLCSASPSSCHHEGITLHHLLWCNIATCQVGNVIILPEAGTWLRTQLWHFMNHKSENVSLPVALCNHQRSMHAFSDCDPLSDAHNIVLAWANSHSVDLSRRVTLTISDSDACTLMGETS